MAMSSQPLRVHYQLSAQRCLLCVMCVYVRVALRQAALISENGFLSSRYDVADIKRT